MESADRCGAGAGFARLLTLPPFQVGTARCTLPARVSAGGTKGMSRAITPIRFRRLTLGDGDSPARCPHPDAVRGSAVFELNLGALTRPARILRPDFICIKPPAT
jgi:hypothetical protein